MQAAPQVGEAEGKKSDDVVALQATMHQLHLQQEVLVCGCMYMYM